MNSAPATAAVETPYDEKALDEKVERLNAILGSMRHVLVGYSGGVDSALLAVAAHRVLGERAVAVTADSESYASGELERAREITETFGIRHEVVRTDELSNPEYAANPVNRCYFCKQALFIHMGRLAEETGASHILYGQNTDDVGDFRPGAQAAKEYGVRAPLQEAGLDKEDVRRLARRWNVPVWNRPAMACLSSRFPYGTPIDADQLRMVDRAEAFLRQEGYEQLRVRHHTDTARIELPPAELDALLADAALRARIADALLETGYARVTADLRGFRSGSLNEVLQTPDLDPQEGQTRADALLEDAFGGAHESQRQGQMLVLRLPADALAGLAPAEARQPLLDGLGRLGLRYIALDLKPRP